MDNGVKAAIYIALTREKEREREDLASSFFASDVKRRVLFMLNPMHREI